MRRRFSFALCGGILFAILVAGLMFLAPLPTMKIAWPPCETILNILHVEWKEQILLILACLLAEAICAGSLVGYFLGCYLSRDKD